MAMDQEEMVSFLFGALSRAMKHRKAELARKEAEERGVFDDDDDEEDDDGLIALDHLRSQGRIGVGASVQAPVASPHNDLLARARAELEDLRQREELARLRSEIRKQRTATAEAEALADEESHSELTRIRDEIRAQKARTEAAEAAEAAATGASERNDDGPEESEEPEAAAALDVDERLAAVEAMGELTLGSEEPPKEIKEPTTTVSRDNESEAGDSEAEPAEDEDEDETDEDDDDDPVAAHPLIVGQEALRRGDARAALDHFTGLVEETRAAHRRRPKDLEIAAGYCQSLRAAATARVALADFPAALRDVNEAVDIAVSLHKKAPSAEALTEVAGSICGKVEVLLAVGDHQGATMVAGDGVRVLKRQLRRHTSREALAFFERLRSLRAMLTRRQAG